MYRDSFSPSRVDPDPTCPTSFGVKAEPPALPCRDDVLVENGAAAPNLYLSPLKMRSPTAPGGLLPADKASTTTRITFYQPRLRFCPTEETNSKRTSTQYASYDSSFWKNILLAAPSCRRVIETKSGQTLVFNPGGSKGRLRACPFWGTWCALLCGKGLVLERLVAIWSVFLQKGVRGISFFGVRYKQRHTYSGRPLFLRSPVGLKRSYYQGRLEATEQWDEQMSESVMERGA